MRILEITDYKITLSLCPREAGQLAQMCRLALDSPKLEDATLEPQFLDVESMGVLFTALGMAALLYGEIPARVREQVHGYIAEDGLSIEYGRAVTL